MSKLWGGRFEDGSNTFFEKFNESFSFDYRLIKADLKAGIAYARGLEKCSCLNANELKQIESGLEAIKEKVENDKGFLIAAFAKNYEDVHTFVESELYEMIGEPAKKLNTGRSRNDQVATDTRIYVREQIDETKSTLRDLTDTMLKHGKKYQSVTIPGYTHLQKAQPVLWAHYLLSWIEMFERDCERLEETRKRVNVLPLGSGALAGNSWGVDREFLAKELGFAKITKNSLDSTGDRDFVVDFLYNASMIMIHLSRLSEDLIIYSSQEFGFMEQSDKVSTGSSLMPHKKNPDALELIRGKCGRVIGHLQGFLMTLKGLPSSYNKDLQEDKECLFDCIDQTKACLKVMKMVFEGLILKKDKLCQASSKGYLNATELADYLVAKGLSFRAAHEVVGKTVLHGIAVGKELHELNLDELKIFSQCIDADVYHSLSLENTVNSKTSFGGTGRDRVTKAFQHALTGM